MSCLAERYRAAGYWLRKVQAASSQSRTRKDLLILLISSSRRQLAAASTPHAWGCRCHATAARGQRHIGPSHCVPSLRLLEILLKGETKNAREVGCNPRYMHVGGHNGRETRRPAPGDIRMIRSPCTRPAVSVSEHCNAK